MSNQADLITKTQKSKATSEGSHEWMAERIYGLFSLFLLVWFMINAAMIYNGHYIGLDDFISKPFNAVLMITFIASFLYYLSLSVKVVIEDYVSCECAKFTMILALRFIGIVGFIASTLAIIRVVID